MDTKTTSPAKRLIEFVREHKMEKGPWSCERANRINDRAVELAVRGGFRFEEGDFGEPGSGIDEGLYAAAIQEGNTSAIAALEYAARRKPFITSNVNPAGNSGPQVAHRVGDRQTCRLAVGFTFRWDDRLVRVTSFAPDSSYLVACAYPDGAYQTLPTCVACCQTRYDLYNREDNKPDRIYKITVADLLTGRASERKKHPKCPLCLKPMEEGQEICDREHRCGRWHCGKPIQSATDGRRVSMQDGRPKWLLCNKCADEIERG
jgi:hypothetical protein